MSTQPEYIEYISEQIASTGAVTSRKMFGEYMVYVNGKPLIIVCDNTAYVKMDDSIKHLMDNADVGAPYKGAKPHYVLDIDNKALCQEIIDILEPITPIPKKRKKKSE